MNLKKIFSRIQKEWSDLDFEVSELEKGKLKFTASNISAKKYFDDDVFCSVSIFDDGTIHIFFTFDEIEETVSNYKLINAFNEKTSFLKGYITEIKDKKYFELHAASVSVPEKEIPSTFSFLLGQIVNDDVLEYLHPITEVTK